MIGSKILTIIVEVMKQICKTETYNVNQIKDNYGCDFDEATGLTRRF